MRFLNHPVTGKPDALMTMSCVVVAICAVKFLFEGLSFAVFGHTVSLGHADAMSYGAMLGPVLGAHGATEWRRIANNNDDEQEGTAQVDNPDDV